MACLDLVETVAPVAPVEPEEWAITGVVVMVMRIMATISTHEDTQTIEAGDYVQLITDIQVVMVHIVLLKTVTTVRVFKHLGLVDFMIVNLLVYVLIDMVLVVVT